MKDTLENKFDKIEQDMKKHFAQQKAESSRLLSQISALKGQEKLLTG